VTKPPTLKVPFCPEIPDTSRNSSALFVGSEASPVFPSNKSSIKMKINTEHWWGDTGKTKILGAEPVSLPVGPQVSQTLVREGTLACAMKAG
jgi:hypothetical protein